ncbi:MAG: dihydroorotase [Eubacteriales bacterium]|nr:dihydroorotase [Eubacteriales bacterium]MDD3350615.1 dihydroorotase [Eubacteriales bacterium]
MILCVRNGFVQNPANKMTTPVKGRRAAQEPLGAEAGWWADTGERMDVIIEDGIIRSMKEPGGTYSDDVTVIDATGKWVVPGFVDLHVHFRDPGMTEKEDISSGCRAAARGGFTTVCCMPNTKPVIDSEETVRYIDLWGSRACGVNLFPIASITKEQKGKDLVDIARLAELETRCKSLTGKGIAALSEDGKTVADVRLMQRAMELAEEYDLPIFAHTEEESLAGGVMHRGRKAWELGLSGVPSEAEEIIVARDILLAKNTGCRLHLCHISTRGSVDLIRLAKSWGLSVTAETAPHYFTLTESSVMRENGLAKMNPPLREAQDVEAICAALEDGTIDVIATDHAPHTESEKRLGMERAPFGIVGLETAFALGYTYLVKAGILSPEELIRKMSLNPAKILGLDRGVIAPGKAADLAVIDVSEPYRIDPTEFHSKGRNTPFGGMRVYGKILFTIADGKVVYDDRSVNR